MTLLKMWTTGSQESWDLTSQRSLVIGDTPNLVFTPEERDRSEVSAQRQLSSDITHVHAQELHDILAPIRLETQVTN